MRIFPLAAYAGISMFFITQAYAEALRSNDIVGIKPGMSVDEVLVKVAEYNQQMVVQKVMTQPYGDVPSYPIILSATISGKKDQDPPQDEITVRFVRYTDGTVKSNAVAHLVYPLPENQRVVFKNFRETLALKYGPISNMNDTTSGEVRWIFAANEKGEYKQKINTLGSDYADYERCSDAIKFIGNTSTRAGLPENAVRGCGEFLYARLFPVDATHADTLGGYYITYIHQDKYLDDIIGPVVKQDTPASPDAIKLEQQRQEMLKNSAPRL